MFGIAVLGVLTGGLFVLSYLSSGDKAALFFIGGIVAGIVTGLCVAEWNEK